VRWYATWWCVGGVSLVTSAVTLVAVAWFPGAAVALSTRSRPPRVPDPASVWSAVRQRPGPSVLWVALTGLVMVRFGPAPLDGGVLLVVVGVAVLSAMVDLRCHRLPDAITAPLWALAWPAMVALAVMQGDALRVRFALMSAVTALLVLGVGWLLGMGLGDVKLGALLALAAGWSTAHADGAVRAGLALVLIAACGAVVHAAVRSVGQWRGRQALAWPGAVAWRDRHWFAFGPYLVAAATVVIVIGGPVVPQ